LHRSGKTSGTGANKKEEIFSLEKRRKAHDHFFLLQPRAADCHMTHADLYSALFALISSQGKNKTIYGIVH
jgi:hypothetical protein